MVRLSPALLLLAALIPSCQCGRTPGKDSTDDTAAPPPVYMQPGALQVGAAEATLDMPIGTPMGGYTARMMMGSNVDGRDSDYIWAFDPSTGLQTRIPVKVFWFDNGQENLVVVQAAVIYAYDGLLPELESRLSAATGLDLEGRVTFSATHTHHGYGNFDGQTSFFLGGDKYNHEIFTRFAERITETAVAAHDSRQEAAVGVGYWDNWDPDDLVSHDRRGSNNSLTVFPDIPKGSFKDPRLWMMRIDSLKGQPIGVIFGFPTHGTTLDGDNPLVTVDSPGHAEIAFEEQFDSEVVVAYLQTGGGDASPGGSDDGFARAEDVGDRAAPLLKTLWDEIQPAPITARLETRTRGIGQTRDEIHVTRGGTVDWSYPPYDSSLEPDGVIYGTDGSVQSPIDEFNYEYGAVFCAEGDPQPYGGCIAVEDLLIGLVQPTFELEDEQVEPPTLETQRSVITAVRLGPVPTLLPDGTRSDEDLIWGFFPGETLSYYVEMYRRRVESELGYSSAVLTGYSQDHEGYLLITEDWLAGGYENGINVWGPLQGDWILDNWFEMAQELATDEIEPQNAHDAWPRSVWGPYELPVHTPDTTSDAGTLLTTSPAYLYSPIIPIEDQRAGENPDLTWQSTVPRVQGIVQFAWRGGDPSVDLPRIALERNDSGTWSEVVTRSGRPITDKYPDIWLAWTPHPLEPATSPQTHTYLAMWQAVGHVIDRAGLPEGEYRFHVNGLYATGGTSWPFSTAPYEFTTDSFTVVPGTLNVAVSGTDLQVSLPSPSHGFRHIAEGGSCQGENPVANDEVSVTWTLGDGSSVSDTLTGVTGKGWSVFTGAVPKDAVSAQVEDIYGNVGSWGE